MTDKPRKPDDDQESDYYRVLSDVITDQKERDTRRSKSAVRRASGNSSTFPGIVAMVCGVLSIYFWTSPPAFIQPPPFSQPSMAEITAGLRTEMAMQVNLINRFRAENGRLPASIEEAGSFNVDLEFSYTRLGSDVFRLSLMVDRETAPLVYDSTQDIETWVGNSRQIIEQGVPSEDGEDVA